MARKIQLKQGAKADLPTLAQGELGFTLDTKELFIGGQEGTGNVDLTQYGKINELDEHISTVDQDVGDKTALATADKSNLVAAINENTQQLADIVVNVRQPPFNATGSGDIGIEDTTAIQDAIAYAESVGAKKLLIPSGYTYLVDKLAINSAIIIEADEAILKQKAGATGDFIIINGNDVRINGLKAIGDPSNTNLDGIVVNGDRAQINNVKTDGFFYSTDVTGDYCEVNNHYAENSLYGSLRLSASIKPLNVFTMTNFRSLNSKFKGFVYNGIQGIRDVNIKGYEAITNSLEPASNGFLTDSDPDNTILSIDRLILEDVYIYGGESGAIKIENVRRAYLKNVKYRVNHSIYAAYHGIRLAGGVSYLDNINGDSRILVSGDLIARKLEFEGNMTQSHVVELNGSGTFVDIDGLDISKTSGISAQVIRVDRTSGLNHKITLDNYNGRTEKTLFGIITVPPNLKDCITLGVRNAGMPASITGSSVNNVRVKRQRPSYAAYNSKPTTDKWERNDIVYLDEPNTVGGYMAYICTKSGEFGTGTEPEFELVGKIGEKEFYLKSANGTRYKITVSDAGALVVTSV